MHLLSRVLMLLATVSMVTLNTVALLSPITAQAADINTRHSVGAPNKATQSAAPNRDIQQCLRAVDQRARQLGRALPPIVHEASRRMCWITQQAESSLGIMATLTVDGLDRAARDYNAMLIRQGFNGRAMTEEPGLLWFDGAREILAKRLADKARTIWTVSAAVGGPPLPAEVLNRLPRSALNASRPVSRSGSATVEQGQFVLVEGNSNSDEAIAVPSEAVLDYVLHDDSPTPPGFVEQFVDAHLQALEKAPDMALGLRKDMFEVLRSAALKPDSQRTANERRFVAAFEGYLRAQYLRMADEALAAYAEWQREQEGSAANTGVTGALGGITGVQQVPPDVYHVMGASVMLSSFSAGLASMIYAQSAIVAGSKAIFASAAAAAEAAALTAGMTAKTAASVGVSAGTQATMNAAASGASGMISASSSAAMGPALVVVGFILAGTLGLRQTLKAEQMKGKLEELKAWTRSGRLSARELLGTREGAIQFLHFYAKATGSGSPSGYTNPADGCRACFHADTNFGGETVCTTGLATRFDDLQAARDGSGTKKLNNAISSVSMDQSQCEGAYVVLYDNKRFRGHSLVVRSAVADLSVFERTNAKDWDDAASSASFSSENAPKCEVCLFSKADFSGAKFCATGTVGSLASVHMADKVTSVLMNTADCPQARVWLYEKKDFERRADGSGVYELDDSVRDLGRGIRNTASSVYFSADGINPLEVAASGGCRACLYDRPNHKGAYMCVNQNIPDMGNYSVAGETHDFANRATSVQFITDDCHPNETLELELFLKPNYRGEVVRLFGQDVGTLLRRHDNSVASAKLRHYDSSRSCQVCLYTEPFFQGEKRCLSRDQAVLDRHLANRVTSIRVEKGGCADGGARLYAERSYKGASEIVMADIPNLRDLSMVGGGNWNNTVASVKFSPRMAQAQAQVQQIEQQVAEQVSPGATTPQREDPATLCGVCLYENANYRGARQCLTADTDRLSQAVRNRVSSIRVDIGACPKGGALVYARNNFNGRSSFVLTSQPNLRSIPGSSDNWNDRIASVRFSRTMEDNVFAAYKRQFVGMPDAQVRQIIERTYGR